MVDANLLRIGRRDGIPVFYNEDPVNLSQPGSSGGGAFINDQLVGIHWDSPPKTWTGKENDQKAIVPFLYGEFPFAPPGLVDTCETPVPVLRDWE